MPVSRYRGLDASQNSMQSVFLIIFLPIFYRPLYILLQVQSSFTDVSFYNISQTSALASENLLRQLSTPRKAEITF